MGKLFHFFLFLFLLLLKLTLKKIDKNKYFISLSLFSFKIKINHLIQLDNADEQAATIRRELDSRMKQAENIQKVISIFKNIFFSLYIFFLGFKIFSNEVLKIFTMIIIIIIIIFT